MERERVEDIPVVVRPKGDTAVYLQMMFLSIVFLSM